MRETTGLSNFRGMAFIGIRASESLSRSQYKYISLGKKHKGQFSCNPILDWNSAELYSYIFYRDLCLNETYKKGNRRAGCLVCPKAAERNEFITRSVYPEEFDKYLKIIKKLYREAIPEDDRLNEFINNGGWKARKNGRDLSLSTNYLDSYEKDLQLLRITNPKTDWKEWIKTIGILLNDKSPYQVLFRNQIYSFKLEQTIDGYQVTIDEKTAKDNPLFVKLLKNVFRKAANCIFCGECEADCPRGFLSVTNGELKISEDCIHCAECHKALKGCLLYKSLEKPKGNLSMSESKSLNCYSHHAPKKEWFDQYFEYKNNFLEKHTLGSQMLNFFKRFLRDAQLMDKDQFTETAQIIDNLGLDNLTSWAIILTNLSYTPQINWYITNLEMNERYSKDYTNSLLIRDGAKESWVNDVWSSFGRFLDLPFNEVGMGIGEKEKRRFISLQRTPWVNPDSLAVLYSLYKFAEACGEYYQFTLSRLLNYDIESNGVSPTQIFGIEREKMQKILNGLSINYPEYITVSFTLDLDNITLNNEKKSSDVLKLLGRTENE